MKSEAEFTEEEIKKAFCYWCRKYYSKSCTGLTSEELLSTDGRPFVFGNQGWLKTARTALCLSASTVATNLQITRPVYSKYEECESRGAITLATLAKTAAAMDCELIYAIRPRNGKSFASIVWEALFQSSLQHSWVKSCNPHRKAEALAFIANRFFSEPKFRKKQGWSQQSTRI